MKDKDARSIILKALYERRAEPMSHFSDDAFPEIPYNEAMRICQDLEKYGMVNFLGEDTRGFFARIEPSGVDAIESDGESSPVALTPTVIQNFHITNSSNFQAGNSNPQEITNSVEKLISAINESQVNEADKEEAKSLLQKALSHPVTSAVLGGLASTIAWK